ILTGALVARLGERGVGSVRVYGPAWMGADDRPPHGIVQGAAFASAFAFALLQYLSPTRHQILYEELHHPVPVDRGVPAVGPDLDLEALAGALERLDQLQRVGGVHVVVGGAVVDHEATAQVVDVAHR